MAGGWGQKTGLEEEECLTELMKLARIPAAIKYPGLFV
jgi:hypothetical protein